MRNGYSICLQGMYGITREIGFTFLETLGTTFDYSGSDVKNGNTIDAYSKTDQHML